MRRGSLWVVAVIATASAALPFSALGHEVGLSRGTWHLQDSTLSVEFVFARREALRLVAALGPDADSLPADVAMDRAVVSRIDVRRADEPCPGAFVDAGAAEGDGFWVRMRYECPDASGPVHVRLAILESLGPGHRHLARVQAGAQAADEVLYAGRPSFDVDPGRAPGVWGFLRMGVEHILGGYDHLIFLFGLILVGGRFRSVLGTITAFTLAHSVTLAIAALGVWSPGPRFVEPAIGLTIAYVGIENLWRGEPRGRWRITFFLGLVHGFGFAAALQELGLSRSQVVPALVLFNVGVELGQVAVLAVLLPLVLWARRVPWITARAVPVASVAIVLAGATLFVMRLA